MVTLFRLLFGVAGFGGILLYRFSVLCEYRFTVGDAAAPARKSAELFLYGSRSVVHRRTDVGKLGVRGRYQLDSRSRRDNLRIGGRRSAVTFPLGRNGVFRAELIKAFRQLRTSFLLLVLIRNILIGIFHAEIRIVF